MGRDPAREDTAGTGRDRKTERGTEQEPGAGRENLRTTDTAVAHRGRPGHRGKRKETMARGRGAPGAGKESTPALKRCLKRTPERCGTPDRGRTPAGNAVTHTPRMMQVPPRARLRALQQACVCGVLEVVAVETSGGGLIWSERTLMTNNGFLSLWTLLWRRFLMLILWNGRVSFCCGRRLLAPLNALTADFPFLVFKEILAFIEGFSALKLTHRSPLRCPWYQSEHCLIVWISFGTHTYTLIRANKIRALNSDLRIFVKCPRLQP